MKKKLLNLKEASDFASKLLNRDISQSNISYLLQYGKITKYGDNGKTQIDCEDLKKYYKSFHGERENNWKKKLGDDLNWNLSFDYLREKDTTKHVHRLHPYKGKYIPQLVEYFLDDHTDEFKKKLLFKKDDIILDPFSGSGTTIIQANELGMHAIGIDISEFNCNITKSKMQKYDLNQLEVEINKLKKIIANIESETNIKDFEIDLLENLSVFNKRYFPTPDFRRDIFTGKFDEKKFGLLKEKMFNKQYEQLVRKYKIKLKQKKKKSFLDFWYIKNTREEIDKIFEHVKKIENNQLQMIIMIILSRAIRSCRATTHSDLATLKEPQLSTYYCFKHKKICKPIFSIKSWFTRYANDTLKRLKEFDSLRSDKKWDAIAGDSRIVDIQKEIAKKDSVFGELIRKKKIKGIFSSPPYVGQIDYHEQHAYAYDLFQMKRKDELEIGPLYKGKGKKAQESYIKGISKVLLNAKKYLVKDYDVFLVANDKFNLYPLIAESANMKIVNQYKRPVLNRTERDKNPYSEIIFHLKEKV